MEIDDSIIILSDTEFITEWEKQKLSMKQELPGFIWWH